LRADVNLKKKEENMRKRDESEKFAVLEIARQ